MAQAEQIHSPWGSRAEREVERAEKRQAVLLTAVRYFNAKGFHATSLADVAQALKVTKPTIYHYFPSKDDILFECVRLGLDALRDAAQRAADQGGSGRDRLRALMVEYGLIMTRDFGKCVTLTSDDLLGETSRAKFRALKREIHEMLQSVIEDGLRDGSISGGGAGQEARIIAFTIAGALNWIARWFDPQGDQSADQIVGATVDSLMAGLMPR